MNTNTESILDICPQTVRAALQRELQTRSSRLEEVRFRAGAPVSIGAEGREWCISEQGNLICATQPMITSVLKAAAEQCLYAAQDQLSQGFLTITGGHRIGVCGKAVVKDCRISTLTEFSSLNIRVAAEVTGCSDSLVSTVWSYPESTLLIGPPGCGKTTLLRDLIRQMSDRLHLRMSLVDERGEVAACCGGVPQFRIGNRTDVLSGCPKHAGIEMLLRAMNPQWIAVDEISAQQDVQAIEHASYCGVRFLATAHAWTREELQKRPVYRQLLECGVFRNLAVIDKNRTVHCERLSS